MTVRITEVYASTQGEGPNVGRTTVFTRFAGCNLRCPGWPCDTPFAIFPEEYRHKWKEMHIDALFDKVMKTVDVSGATHVTLTGGEPFIQPRDDLKALTGRLIEEGLGVDCFSNGTREYPKWAVEFIQFIMDWKLPGSGEDPFDPVRIKNVGILNSSRLPQSIKFVIKDGTDYFKAKELYMEHLADKPNIEVFYGKVWEGGKLKDKNLVAWVMEDRLPWRLNIQTHNYVWPAHERAR